MTSHDDASGPQRTARSRGRDEGEALGAALDRLRARQSGVGFIYGALDLIVSHFDLRDAVIVLDDGRGGTQVFRAGGKTVSPDRTALIHAAPGLYCDPPVVADDDVEAVLDACRREMNRLRSFRPEGDATSGNNSRRKHSLAVGASVDEERSGSKERITFVEQVDRGTGERLAGSRGARLVVSRFFVLVDVLNLALALGNVHGSVRFVFGLVLGIAIPGWSIVGLLRLRYAALEIGLTMATSLAFIMVSAQFLITAHLWHLVAFEEFVCMLCLPSLLWQSRRQSLEPRRRV